MRPLVYVVLLNYNGRAYLSQFLPSLLRTRYPNYQVIVGDNASTDDSLSFLAAQYPKIPVLRNPKNYGFAQGYNQILAQLREQFPPAAYLVLLNSDAAVSEDWLDPLIDRLESDTRIAAVQPKILDYYAQDSFEYAGACGGFMDYLLYPFCRGRIFMDREKDLGQYDQPVRVFWVSGVAFCVRATVFYALGGFNPYFFAHHEEIDLCWRMQNAGYTLMAVPASTVYHVGGGTLSYQSPQKVYLNHRNNLVMIANNLPFFAHVWRIVLRILAEGCGFGLYNLCRGKRAICKAILRAHWDFLRWYISARKRTPAVYKSGKGLPAHGVYKGLVVYHFYRKQYRRIRRFFQHV